MSLDNWIGSLLAVQAAPEIVRALWPKGASGKRVAVPEDFVVLLNNGQNVLNCVVARLLDQFGHGCALIDIQVRYEFVLDLFLRKRFQSDTRLHRQIGRLVHRVITRWMARQVGCHRNRREERDQARPGIIMAVQSFGSELRAHVHFHILVTDGVYFPDGSYFALGFWDQPSPLGELRHSILKSLVARNCLQPETAKLLESWPLDRSGFSAFVGDPIGQPADRPRLQRVLNYILRRL